MSSQVTSFHWYFWLLQFSLSGIFVIVLSRRNFLPINADELCPLLSSTILVKTNGYSCLPKIRSLCLCKTICPATSLFQIASTKSGHDSWYINFPWDPVDSRKFFLTNFFSPLRCILDSLWVCLVSAQFSSTAFCFVRLFSFVSIEWSWNTAWIWSKWGLWDWQVLFAGKNYLYTSFFETKQNYMLSKLMTIVWVIFCPL